MASRRPGALEPAQPRDEDGTQEVDRLTDEELDAYILTRLKNVGVDISVLPEDDEDAPADQVRILASARRFLRGSVRVISDLSLTPEAGLPGSIPMEPYPPGMYPSALSRWTDES
ncbi:MAG: hypothetical protein HKN73_00740 [Gemmatimonadetes bacterium]|nr:hypothetical protein [Gemmatimonadota bacterium]